jgi:hypothetical protein
VVLNAQSISTLSHISELYVTRQMRAEQGTHEQDAAQHSRQVDPEQRVSSSTSSRTKPAKNLEYKQHQVVDSKATG